MPFIENNIALERYSQYQILINNIKGSLCLPLATSPVPKQRALHKKGTKSPAPFTRIDSIRFCSRLEWRFHVAECQKYLDDRYNAETGDGLGARPFFAGCEALMAVLQTELETGFNPYIIEDVGKKPDNRELIKLLNITQIFDGIIE